MFIVIIIKIKDVLDSEWALTSSAFCVM